MTTKKSYQSVQPKALGSFFIMALLCGCGGGGGSGLPISWTIDAKDWTNPSAAADLRDCLNQPTQNHTNIDYPTLKTVHIEVRDPLNQIQPAIRDVPCEAGIGGEAIDFGSLTPNEYDVYITAIDASGKTIYRFEEKKVDITTKATYDVELRADTGETRFSLTIDGAATCPTSASQIQWSAFKDGEEEAFATDVIKDICVDTLDAKVFDTLYARGIPVTPTYLEGTQKYDVNTYKFQVELQDENGQGLGCSAKVNRTIRPGFIGTNASLQSSTNNIALTNGACPQ